MLLCKSEKRAEKNTLNSLNANPKSQDNREKGYKKIEYNKANNALKEEERSALLSAFQRASLTVEAAVVLPFFLMFFTALYSLFGMMMFQNRLQVVLNNAAREWASYCYAIEKYSESDRHDKEGTIKELGINLSGYVAPEIFVRRKMSEAMPDVNQNPLIAGGSSGLFFTGSGFNDETQEITVCVRYRVRIPFVSEKMIHSFFLQKAVSRAWTGRKMPDSLSEQTVYITETGTVYHTSLSCTHLKIKTEAVQVSGLDGLRNENGARYYECELCKNHPHGRIRYVTASGTRYHYDLNCSGLKRTVKSILLSEVGDRKECSRCSVQGRKE